MRKRLFEEKVTISAREYRRLVTAEEKKKIEKLEDERYDLIFEKRLLKNLLLESNLRESYIERYPLEELTDIESWNYGLHNAIKLVQVFSIEEMNLFIQQKKEEFENKQEQENEM